MTGPRRRRWSLLLWTAIVLGMATTLALAWQLERARRVIRQSLDRQPGVRVAVGRVRLAWPPGRVVVEDVTVSWPGGSVVLSMPRLILIVNPFSLVQRSLTVSHASAEAPRLAMAMARLNEISQLLTLATSAPRGAEPGRTVSRGGRLVALPSTLSLTGGNLHLETRSGRWELTGISGRLVRRESGLHLALAHPTVGRLTAEVLPGRAGDTEATMTLKISELAPVLTGGRGTIAGNLSGTFRMVGRALTGDLNFSAFRVEWPGLPPITDGVGRLRFEPTFVELEEVQFRSGEGSRVVGHARLRLRPPLRLTFRATASELDLTPWVEPSRVVLTPEPGGSSLSVIPPAHAAGSPVWGSLLGRQLASLRVDGRVAVARGRIGALRFAKGSAHILASDGQWVVQGVRLRLDGGEQRGYLKFSFPHRSGEVFLAAERLPLDQVYALLVPGARLLGGRASYSAELRWKGLTWSELRQSLSGRGVLRVEDGWLPAGAGRGGAQRDLRFRDLSSRFRVSAGRIVTDDLEIRGEPWALLRGGGQVDFSGKLALRVASPPDRAPRLQGLLTGDLTQPYLTILEAEF